MNSIDSASPSSISALDESDSNLGSHAVIMHFGVKSAANPKVWSGGLLKGDE